MLQLKDLPPWSGRKRFAVSHGCKTAPGRRCRLIRAHCSFYDNGNCLYLDDGEEVVCPQITSFSVICAFFRQVVLKDETARGLEAKLFRRETANAAVCAQDLFFDFNNANTARLPGGDAAKAEGCLCPEAEGKRRKVGLRKGIKIKAFGLANFLPHTLIRPTPKNGFDFSTRRHYDKVHLLAPETQSHQLYTASQLPV